MLFIYNGAERLLLAIRKSWLPSNIAGIIFPDVYSAPRYPH